MQHQYFREIYSNLYTSSMKDVFLHWYTLSGAQKQKLVKHKAVKTEIKNELIKWCHEHCLNSWNDTCSSCSDFLAFSGKRKSNMLKEQNYLRKRRPYLFSLSVVFPWRSIIIAKCGLILLFKSWLAEKKKLISAKMIPFCNCFNDTSAFIKWCTFFLSGEVLTELHKQSLCIM